MDSIMLYSGNAVPVAHGASSPVRATNAQVYGFSSGVLLSLDADWLGVTLHLSAFAARELARELDKAADALATQEGV